MSRIISLFLILITTDYGIAERIIFAHNHKIWHEKGLIFAKEKNLFFITRDWQLKTEVWTDDIYSAAPTFEQLKLDEMRSHCVNISERMWGAKMPQKCEDHIRRSEFWGKIKRVESLKKKLAVYTFVNEAEKKYNSSVVNYLRKQREFLFDIEAAKKKSIPRPSLNPTLLNTLLLDAFQNKYEVLSRTSHEYDIYMSHMYSTVISRDDFLKNDGSRHTIVHYYTNIILRFLIGIDKYIELVEDILRGLDMANEGKLHQNIIPLSSIHTALEMWKISENRGSEELVIPTKDVNWFTLNKFSRLRYEYEDASGKLIFYLTIPLIRRNQKFSLHHLIPSPVHQKVGSHSTQLMAYIQPRADYLLVAPDGKKYTLLFPQDLSLCTIIDYDYICPEEIYTFANFPEERTCEMNIFHGLDVSESTIFEGCDVKLIKNVYPYFRRISGVWLYSLPFPEQFDISCYNTDGIYSTKLTLESTGALHLDIGCRATSKLRVLRGEKGNTTILEGAREFLNLSELIPDLREFEILEEFVPMTSMEENQNPYILQYDYSLNELVRMLRTKFQITNIKATAQCLQITTFFILTLVCLISIYQAFPETVRATFQWLQYSFCRCTYIVQGDEEPGRAVPRAVYHREPTISSVPNPCPLGQNAVPQSPVCETPPPVYENGVVQALPPVPPRTSSSSVAVERAEADSTRVLFMENLAVDAREWGPSRRSFRGPSSEEEDNVAPDSPIIFTSDEEGGGYEPMEIRNSQNK